MNQAFLPMKRFKYLALMVYKEEGMEVDVIQRIKEGWLK